MMDCSIEREWFDAGLERLGERRSTEKEWCRFQDENTAGPSDADFHAGELAALRREWRHSGGERVAQVGTGVPATAHAPAGGASLEHWHVYVERLFEHVRREQRQAWSTLRLEGALEPRDMEEMLRALHAQQREEGDLLTLDVPLLADDGSHYRVERWTVYRGYSPREWDGKGQPPVWAGAVTQPLAILVEIARHVTENTGCRQEEALLFLLCDTLPHLAAASAWADLLEPFAIHIEVRTPFLDPDVVTDMYKRARGRIFAGEDASADEVRTAGVRPWSAELVRFVALRRHAGVPWRDVYEQWGSRYPERQYATVEAMRRAYASARRRLPFILPRPAAAWAAEWEDWERIRRRSARPAEAEQGTP